MPSISHEPAKYDCPFCRLQRDEFNDWNQPTDVVAVTERAYARIAPKWWPGNPGAALVMPRAHVENLYTMQADDGHAVWDLTQRVAIAIRDAYGCEGTSTRQHNEPAGNQDVWHLHVHVFPRYTQDQLYQRHDHARWVPAAERADYAEQLRSALGLPITFAEARSSAGRH